MTSRYHWVAFADWQAMTSAERNNLERWARKGGMEVGIDLRDDHQKDPKTEKIDNV